MQIPHSLHMWKTIIYWYDLIVCSSANCTKYRTCPSCKRYHSRVWREGRRHQSISRQPRVSMNVSSLVFREDVRLKCTISCLELWWGRDYLLPPDPSSSLCKFCIWHWSVLFGSKCDLSMEGVSCCSHLKVQSCNAAYKQGFLERKQST